MQHYEDRLCRLNAMIEQLNTILANSLESLTAVARNMVWPAIFFFCLGYLVKRRALITDIRRALAESSLNIQILVFNLLFVLPLIAVASQVMSNLIVSRGLYLIDPSFWLGLPPLLTIAIAIFIGDFVGYWRHRLEHTPLLWPSHAVHHSDTEMTWLSLERFHPINRMTTFVIDAGALLVLGMPPYGLIANSLVRHYYGFFIHADLPWTYGPLARVFVSPAMHRWHHAADKRAFNTNYATVFSIFDRAFGTYRVPGPCTVPLGVTDDMAPTLRGQMLYALSPRAYQRLRRRRGDSSTRST